MPRKIVLFSIVLTAVLFCLSLAHAQTAKEEKGRAKTMKLPSGEVIYDLSGEWAASIEHYGPWKQYGVFPDIVEIKQEGNSFVAVTLLGSPRSPKGSKKIEGELDEAGFKKVQTLTGAGPVDMKGKILSYGNRVILDDEEKMRLMLIRR